MSSSSVKLFIYLQCKAYWTGPKRGWVEESFEDMAKGMGWSTKTVQRTIEELESKSYIEVDRATNQYELTRIRIDKFDVEHPTPAVDKSVQSSDGGVDRGVDSGMDKSVQGSVHSSASISQSNQDLQAPKNAKKYRSKEKDFNPLTPLKGGCDGFEDFWFEYPKKVAKQKTLRAWNKIKPPEVPAILASVETFKKTEQWRRDGGRFIPYPTTFLNDRRWEDEVSGASQEPRSGGEDKFDDIPIY
jgi:hypothetical protein